MPSMDNVDLDYTKDSFSGDPFQDKGGMHMQSQAPLNMNAMGAGKPDDDLTEEEQMLVAQVEEESQKRK